MKYLPCFTTEGDVYILVHDCCACGGSGSSGESDGINKMVAVCRYKLNFTYYACCATFFFAMLRTEVVDKLGSEQK